MIKDERDEGGEVGACVPWGWQFHDCREPLTFAHSWAEPGKKKSQPWLYRRKGEAASLEKINAGGEKGMSTTSWYSRGKGEREVKRRDNKPRIMRGLTGVGLREAVLAQT